MAGTEVAKATKQEMTMSGYFTSELDRISGALPADFNKQRLAINYVSLIQSNADLQKYSKEELATSLVRMAQDNLDALNGEVYIHKGFNGKLTYTPSYKGLRKMAIERSVKPIDQIICKIIYEGDTLEESIVNGEAHLSYKSSLMNKKKQPLGVFALAKFKDGTETYEIMTKEETDKAKAMSKNSGAWKNWETEMMKKTCIRRLAKNITIDFSSVQQADMFSGAEETISDPKEKAEKEIAENANQQSFEDEDVVEVELTEADRVVEGEQQSFVAEE